MVDPISSLTFLTDLLYYLEIGVYYFQIIFMIAIAGLIFLGARKVFNILNPDVKNELAAVLAIIAAYFVWTQLIVSLVLTGALLVIFYLFGGIIIAFATYLAVILK